MFYLLTGGILCWSYRKDRGKTKQALKKGWKAFENILPDFLLILLLVGFLLAVVSPDTVSQLLGKESGLAGTLIAGIVGSVTLIPAFIAFPLVKAVLDMGAGIVQVAVFISTLMMVGVVTAPLEAQFFSYRVVLLRNGLSFALAYVIAYVLSKVVA